VVLGGKGEWPTPKVTFTMGSPKVPVQSCAETKIECTHKNPVNTQNLIFDIPVDFKLYEVF
jgi:hypothetical protein